MARGPKIFLNSEIFQNSERNLGKGKPELAGRAGGMMNGTQGFKHSRVGGGNHGSWTMDHGGAGLGAAPSIVAKTLTLCSSDLSSCSLAHLREHPVLLCKRTRLHT